MFVITLMAPILLNCIIILMAPTTVLNCVITLMAPTELHHLTHVL